VSVGSFPADRMQVQWEVCGNPIKESSHEAKGVPNLKFTGLTQNLG
jgi:hypothetical protein